MNRRHPSTAGARLFVAVDLPEEVRRRLRAVDVPPFFGQRHPLDKLHLTLLFLGQITPSQHAVLLERLPTVQRLPFTLGVQGVGKFGKGLNPRTLWAGIAGDLAALSELREAMLSMVIDAGVQPDVRPFAPHVTLVYCSHFLTNGDVVPFLKQHETLNAGSFIVSGFTLYSSANGRYSPELRVCWPG